MTEEIWLVERYVDLGNEAFWHELARFYRRKHHTDEGLTESGHLVGKRDAAKYGARYRIRVVKEATAYDTAEGSD